MSKSAVHNFHIPVMGLGFSIDTPLKVAHYGIDSVVSIVDDDLIEKMRKVHCKRTGRTFSAISVKEDDYRAKRITAYLNLLEDIVNANFDELIESYAVQDGEFEKYIDLLPEDSEIKRKYIESRDNNNLQSVKHWMFANMRKGSIDVNIMTKIDKANYNKNEKLPSIYNDAHSALRGYANCNLDSSLVLSAGLNPRLYSYMEEFKDFYPDQHGHLKKRIILKVSDYRSALIQGKFLAKKGLWVSEYRIESGLNCGGHAFATEGYLMGPILNEFKENRDELLNSIHRIYREALGKKGIELNELPFEMKITAQGGVGTYEEQSFLTDYYNIDSVGWGTPFLLVPEVTNVDETTLSLLSSAKEDDLYLSRISPLGVPFNSVRGSSKDFEKLENALNGKPGSPCPKKYLQFNSEFSDKPICTASIKYQNEKLKQLNSLDISKSEHDNQHEKIIDKTCLCVGLATSVLTNHNAETKSDGTATVVCPGPNLAYFSSIKTLKEMVGHICGRENIISRTDRPHMFIKEFKLYINYINEQISDEIDEVTNNRIKYYETFTDNLIAGLEYYRNLFNDLNQIVDEIKSKLLHDLTSLENEIQLVIERMVLQGLMFEKLAYTSKTAEMN